MGVCESPASSRPSGRQERPTDQPSGEMNGALNCEIIIALSNGLAHLSEPHRLSYTHIRGSSISSAKGNTEGLAPIHSLAIQIQCRDIRYTSAVHTQIFQLFFSFFSFSILYYGPWYSFIVYYSITLYCTCRWEGSVVSQAPLVLPSTMLYWTALYDEIKKNKNKNKNTHNNIGAILLSLSSLQQQGGGCYKHQIQSGLRKNEMKRDDV